MKRKYSRVCLVFCSVCIFLCLVFLFLYSSNENNENLNDSKDKVIFENVGVSANESISEIVKSINESESETITLIIELDNPYESSVERRSDISLEEAQEILRQQRKSVKEYYSQTNAKILATLDISDLDISLKADDYAPYLFGKFNKEITEKDIESIYRMAQNEYILKIYVSGSFQAQNELASALDAIDGSVNVNSMS